jgi:hypothetical protein
LWERRSWSLTRFVGGRRRGMLVAILYLFCSIALLVLGGYFLRLAIRFHREAKQSALPSPEKPPDFSQLQDGSQIVRNLEDM